MSAARFVLVSGTPDAELGAAVVAAGGAVTSVRRLDRTALSRLARSDGVVLVAPTTASETIEAVVTVARAAPRARIVVVRDDFDPALGNALAKVGARLTSPAFAAAAVRVAVTRVRLARSPAIELWARAADEWAEEIGVGAEARVILGLVRDGVPRPRFAEVSGLRERQVRRYIQQLTRATGARNCRDVRRQLRNRVEKLETAKY